LAACKKDMTHAYTQLTPKQDNNYRLPDQPENIYASVHAPPDYKIDRQSDYTDMLKQASTLGQKNKPQAILVPVPMDTCSDAGSSALDSSSDESIHPTRLNPRYEERNRTNNRRRQPNHRIITRCKTT